MRLYIELEMDNAAFEDGLHSELSHILSTVADKVDRQASRADGCICDADEVDDKLLDSNGNTVGRVRLEK